MVADFDGREITFSKKDLFDVTRAYAITIHKAQGSEFPLVILSLTMQNYVMLKRNLLYTAVTRAEKNLVLIGDPRAYEMALNNSGNDRQTGLTAKLQTALNVKDDSRAGEKPDKNRDEQDIAGTDTLATTKQDYILTPELIYSGQIDPMIGMQNIKLETKTR